ncbi:hypothetical protein [Microbacterium sp. 2FI]|uniref:hypothetical protein n=1 Tax=Microbacterium sp. 2FI TaxID=2502193 RepID=UPI0010F54291|nr:hypothetical protein [Microbacterium sp. 2FI]
MDYSTNVGYTLSRQQLADHAREIEMLRRVAERHAFEAATARASAPMPVSPERAWHRLLVRVHLVRPLVH